MTLKLVKDVEREDVGYCLKYLSGFIHSGAKFESWFAYDSRRKLTKKIKREFFTK